MAEKEPVIGIDLGTTNSVVATVQSGQPLVIRNRTGSNLTPSVVAVSKTGKRLVGQIAKRQAITNPQETVYAAKRLIGRKFSSQQVQDALKVLSYQVVCGEHDDIRVRLGGKDLSLPEVSAMVLRELKADADQYFGRPVSRAVITVPAHFNDGQRQATKDAGRIAGLDVLRIINEPTAAALSYGFGRGLTQRVAVYDLGGGTFDISILEIGQDVFEVLATCGDTYLGGDDFDDRVIDLLADEFVAKHGVNVRKDPYALEKLKFAAENAKRALSVEDEAEIRIPDIAKSPSGETLTLEHKLTSKEFGALVGDLVQRTFKVCDEALQQAGLVPRDLEGVILVGGPTRLPMIREAVTHYFGQTPKTDVDPDQVVAMGAAIHASTLVEGTAQDAFLLDVTPLSLRIGVAGGLAEPVIERNTPVPIEQTRTFTTYQDFQESVKISVYQGESRRAEENELLGQFEFSGFKKLARGQVKIDVTFSINSDGLVNVTASDRETGRKASTTITLSSGLSAQELEAIVAENRTQRVAATDVVPVPEEGSLETIDDSELGSLIEEDLEELGGLGIAPEATGNALFDREMRDLSGDDEDSSET